MCEPASIIMGITAAISAITSTVTSIETENRAIEAQNEANIHNANMAIEEANDLSKQEGIAQQQEQQAIAEQALQLKRKNMQETGKAKASSEAEGIASRLVANELSRSLSNDISVLQQNLRMSASQHDLARDMYQKSARNQITGLKDIKMSNRAALGVSTGIDIANAGVGAYNNYNKNKKAT